MAFVKNPTVGHNIQWGKGTLAEADALLGAMTVLQRAQITGSSFEVAGDTSANNGVWVITATSRYKVSNDAEAGTMDTFTVKVGSQTDVIGDDEVVEFAGTGLINVALTAGANGEALVTTKIASTVADAGKVVKVDGNGDAVLAPESFIDVEDGLTVNLGLGTDGILTAEVISNTNQGITNTASGVAAKLSTDSRQAVSFGSDGGIYAKALAIAADSQTRLSYDAGTNTIGLTALGMTRVTVDSTSSDATEAYTDNAADLQEGDVIIITATQEAYIHNGGDTDTISDWTLIETPEITDAAIKALFGGELGVKFNAASGKMSADLREVDLTHPNDIELDGNHLFVDILAKQSDIGLAGGTQTLQKNLTDMVTYASIAVDRTFTNALSTTTDANGKVTGVKHGGSLTQETEVQLGNYNYNLASNGTGVINVTTDNFAISHGFWALNDAEEQVYFRFSSFNTLYVDTTAVYPNS